MLKQFAKDFVIYTISGLFTRSIAFILLPFYSRQLSPNDYGAFDYLTALGALVGVTAALEITQGLARALPESRDGAERRRYSSTALWFTVATYTAVTGVIVLFRDSLARHLLGTADFAPSIAVAAASYFATGLNYFVVNQLRWELRAAASSVLAISTGVATIIFASLLVGWLQLGLTGALLAQGLATAIGAGVGFILARPSFDLIVDRKKLREMLAFSLPLVPSSLGVVVALYVDRLAIGQLMSLADVGVYGVAARIGSISSLLLLGFQGALTPLVFTYYREKETPERIAQIFRWFVVFAVLFIIALAMTGSFILRIVSPAAYSSAAAIAPILSAACIFQGMYIFAPGLAIARRTGSIAAISLCSATANAAFNFILIPVLGILGAALATLVTSVAGFLVYLGMGQKHYPIPYPYGLLIIVAGVAALGMAWIIEAAEASLAYRLIADSVVLGAVAPFLWQLTGLNKAIQDTGMMRGQLRAALTIRSDRGDQR